MSQLRVQLEAWGGQETESAPVRVELVDGGLKTLELRWSTAQALEYFELEPGLYCLRVSTASGAAVTEPVLVAAEGTDVTIPLHELSPHESHEWAYFTEAAERPDGTLGDAETKALWMRLWASTPEGKWELTPFSPETRADWKRDGVSYGFRFAGGDRYMLQIGGPAAGWKLISLPPNFELMTLVRPATSATAEHPVDVVVCSDHWVVESLLRLLQRGEVGRAKELAETAEDLLFGKVSNPLAAAVGGYYLLRVNALERMHNWAGNLAGWFEWLPDGAVIRAWQLLGEAPGRPETEANAKLAEARGHLLDAAGRGVPVYTEGLRLLRDGLLSFHRMDPNDEEVAAAWARIGEYAEAADWSSPVTAFLGERPDAPSSELRFGEPDGDEALAAYVFDVPADRAIERLREMGPGEESEKKDAGTLLEEIGERAIEVVGPMVLKAFQTLLNTHSLPTARRDIFTKALPRWKQARERAEANQRIERVMQELRAPWQG